jgi:hypothetical protein
MTRCAVISRLGTHTLVLLFQHPYNGCGCLALYRPGVRRGLGSGGGRLLRVPL